MPSDLTPLLHDLCESGQVDPKQWDEILVGDGSGSKWGQAGGWACLAVAKHELVPRVYYGAANNLTNNLAEMLAYLSPLSELANRVHREEIATMRRVHIFTDSEYVRKRGEKGRELNFGAHTALWGAFELFARSGLSIAWHWIPRDSSAMNRAADEISRQARIRLQEADHAIRSQEHV